MLALIVAFSAAIGVSAVTVAISNVEAFYAYDDNQINYIQNYNTPFYFYNGTIGQYERPKFGIMVYNELEKDYTYEYQIEITVTRPIGDSSITSDIYSYGFYPNRLINLIHETHQNAVVNVNIQNATIYINVLFNTVDDNSIYGNPYFYISLLALYTGNTSGFTVSNIKAYKVYDPGKSEFDYIYESIKEIISNQQTIINNQSSNSSNLNQQLNNIILNQNTQNQNWQTLISYGNNYNQINSNLIGNLGTAEDQLSSAEDALENKSQSLKDSVSTQWQNIQSSSKTFITNIAPAAAAVGIVITQFMDAAPEEVKGLFITIPLLIFIGWLIGRIRGD